MTQIDAPYRLYERPATAFISAFVGKMNRLDGVWRRDGAGGHAEVAGVKLPSEATDLAEGHGVSLSIRPEKLLLRALGQGRLDGKIANRFFLGSYWLFNVETPVGLLSVSVPNDGEEPPAEGAGVALDWAPASLRAEAPGAQGVAA